MDKLYTYREIIQAQLDGKTVQEYEGYDENGTVWKDCTFIACAKVDSLDNETSCYRIKPKMEVKRYCNGVELAQSVTKELEEGTKYYTPSLNKKKGYESWLWYGDNLDYYYLDAGFVYLNAEDALQHYHAIMQIEIKGVEVHDE